MNRMIRTFMKSLAAVTIAVITMWSSDAPLTSKSQFVSAAEARIGRPMTPMSYAGVARRTTRRAVVGGAVVGGAVVGGAVVAPYVAGPRCTQVVDAYGQIITRCY